MGIGDWGLGIGDWGLAQSPIPNPQSPIPIKFNRSMQNDKIVVDILYNYIKKLI